MSKKKRMRKLLARMNRAARATRFEPVDDDCPICRLLAGAESTEVDGFTVTVLTPELAESIAQASAGRSTT